MENYVAEIFVVELLARGAVLCLLMALILGLFRRSAAAYRHLMCVLALFGLFVLPFAQRLLPPIPLLPSQIATIPEQATVPQPEMPHPSSLPSKPELPSQQDRLQEPKPGNMPATLISTESVPASRNTTVLTPAPDREHTRRATSLLFAVWAMGASVLLIRLMVALSRLRKLEANSRQAMLGNVPIRISEKLNTPLTWGIRRSVILLPSTLFSGNSAICDTALRHEQAHIARWDWIWNLFAEIACACCWFQPGAWWLRRRLRLESERACDDRVLLSGITGPDYAAHLLQILRTVCTNEIAPAMAQCRGMEERMTHILDTVKPRRAQTTWLAVSALLALALLSLAALRVCAKPAETSGDRTLTGHLKPVNVVAFSPDSKRLVTGSADGTAIVWDVTTGQNLRALKGNTAAVTTALFTPDGKRVITGDSDGTVHTWDATSGKQLRTMPGSEGGGVCALDISADGVNLLTGYNSGKVKVWNASTGQGMMTFAYDNQLLSAAISPDGKSVAAGYLDATLKVWDTQTQHSLFSRKTSVSDGITVTHFDKQNTLYTWGHEAAKDGKPKVLAMTAWSIEDMKTGGSVILSIITFPGTENTVSHAVDYDTFTMMYGLSEGQAILNNMRDGAVTLDAHEGPVAAATISPDGAFAATGGQRNGKGEAKIWVIKAHRPAKTTQAKL